MRIAGGGGGKRYHFAPTISGFLFAYLDEAKVYGLLTDWGYFRYRIDVTDPQTGSARPQDIVTQAHLLCPDSANTPKADIIAKARIPQRDIDRLRLFNDRLVEGIEDLRILDLRYDLLAEQNDTVLITEGPYIGIEGIIRQSTVRGRRDHRFHFSVGNWTVCVPSIRAYRHVVVREARQGKNAEQVNVWRHIDRLIGRIQAQQAQQAQQALQAAEAPTATTAPRQRSAAGELRDILRALNHDVRLDDYQLSLPADSLRRRLLDSLDREDNGALISLSRYFQTYDRSIDVGLRELIPDSTLRPFLTPTAGPPPAGLDGCTACDVATLCHDGFQEVILPTDLRPYFILPPEQLQPEQVADCSRPSGRQPSGHQPSQPAADPSAYFTYHAHIALLPQADGSVLALTSWGDFIRQYLLRSVADRTTILSDFRAKGYSLTASLLEAARVYTPPTTSTPPAAIARDATANHTLLYMYSRGTLAGIARRYPAAPGTDSLRDLVAALAPSAVELWQGTRLLAWRKLAQRHVLLHKA